MHPIYMGVEATVVVGSVMLRARYAPDVVVQVSVRGVPLSLMRKIKRWPSEGDPDGAAIVAFVARPVTSYCV